MDLPRRRIGLGTNRLRHTPQNEAFIRAAVEAGIGMIDTAHMYTGGESEATIGAALAGRPQAAEGVIVATKGGWDPGHGRPHLLGAEIDESLRRLRTDRIDLYYLHRVDSETPLEVSLGALKAAQEAGKIRDIGLSQVSVEQIERARRVVTVAAVQHHYSLAERQHDDVVDYCTREGIVFVPFFPLRNVGVPPQQALAWLLRRSPVMLPIPGTLSIDHVRENLGALDVELSDEELAALSR